MGKTDMAQRVTMVANETQTKALAEFLGGMWTEMRKFSSPFYKQHLEDEGEEVEVELKKHKSKLEDARDEEAAAKKELLELIEKEKEAKGEKTGSRKRRKRRMRMIKRMERMRMMRRRTRRTTRRRRAVRRSERRRRPRRRDPKGMVWHTVPLKDPASSP